MEEKLPESVDVIVLGTGLPEAIIAAACARSGLKVLHLDRNDYYGEDWSSFNMNTIDEFVDNSRKQTAFVEEEKVKALIQDDECFELLGDRRVIDEVNSEWMGNDPECNREKVKPVSRRFSIDLLPKLLLSRGPMVQTLCDSQVSQYAEFKLVDRQLCPSRVEDSQEIKLNRVPCSKGEIFKSTVLSMMEKRALMKFITFCNQWQSKNQEEKVELIGDYVDRPFQQFLESMGVDDTLRSFIINTIGILEPNPTTLQGMTASCKFMDSVGHFGASPFLYPLYGCGELSQCFCRLAAVFGCLYCLGRPVEGVVKKIDKIVAVIADGQRINCEHLIVSSRYVADNIEASTSTVVQRRVYLTDKSLMVEEKEHISLINVVPLMGEAKVGRIVEAGFEACTAPKGYFVVHVTESSSEKNIEEIASELFEKNDIEPLWKLSFRMNRFAFDCEALPTNMSVAPGIDDSICYEQVIDQCRLLFCGMFPDRDFLPRGIRTEDDGDLEEDAKEIDESAGS